jgi:uncharacterized protein YycO
LSLRTAALSLSIPIQKGMQKLHPPEAQTTVAQAQAAMLTMLPGDILLSREAWHFTNMFIPGFWGHAAIYGHGKVVEAVAPCVQVVAWEDWVTRKHNWCVLRPLSAISGENAFNFSMQQVGIKYDYRFSKANGLFFCSELAYDAWDATSSWGQDVFTKRKTMGEWTVTPDDFYLAAQESKLNVIHEWRDK